jgi:hypothetical protein
VPAFKDGIFVGLGDAAGHHKGLACPPVRVFFGTGDEWDGLCVCVCVYVCVCVMSDGIYSEVQGKCNIHTQTHIHTHIPLQC